MVGTEVTYRAGRLVDVSWYLVDAVDGRTVEDRAAREAARGLNVVVHAHRHGADCVRGCVTLKRGAG